MSAVVLRIPRSFDTKDPDCALQIVGVCPQTVGQWKVLHKKAKLQSINEGVVDAMENHFQLLHDEECAELELIAVILHQEDDGFAVTDLQEDMTS